MSGSIQSTVRALQVAGWRLDHDRTAWPRVAFLFQGQGRKRRYLRVNSLGFVEPVVAGDLPTRRAR